MTGGGTAGHITPLLAVAKQLVAKSPSTKLVLVIERGNPNEELIKNSGIPFIIHHIYAGKYRRYHNQSLKVRLFAIKKYLLNIRDVFFVLIGLIQSFGLMFRYRPSVVFSKGGYVSVPVSLAASLTLRKIVTHDSDSIPGLANRLVSRLARRNAVGVIANNSYSKKKIVYTGVPVSEEYLKRIDQDSKTSKKEIGFPEDCELLFIGGSTQGARVIDDAAEQVVPKLLEDFSNLEVVHVFGRLNESTMTERYLGLDEKLKTRLHLKVFLNDQYKYAAAADIVVTRAGATAMAEYGVLGKACIVVPAEQLAAGHQLQNSKAYIENSAALVISEEKLKGELYDKIRYLLQHKSERVELGKRLKSITPSDAAERLAEVILGEM